MATTVVGLFENQSDAQASLQDLLASGFDQSDIDVRGGGGIPVTAGLENELNDGGVPDRDARLYVQGVAQGDTLQILHSADERADLGRDIMNRHGAIDIYHANQVRTATTTTTTGLGTAAAATGLAAVAAPAVAAATTADRTVAAGEQIAVPVIEEELVVGKREVERGGAIIHKRVTERPVSEQVTLHEERVVVERTPVNRAATTADTAFRENTIEVTETSEEAVVGKTARVVEEVIVGKQATDRVETVTDTVRRTDVEVDEITTGTTTTGTSGTIR